jgi:hypothetical protein
LFFSKKSIPFYKVETFKSQLHTLTVALEKPLLAKLGNRSGKLLSGGNILDIRIFDAVGSNIKISHIKLIALWRATAVERGIVVATDGVKNNLFIFGDLDAHL